MTNAYLIEKLNLLYKDNDQVDAYESLENTVVLAGPGSGKTTVLTLKIMQLLEDHIQEPRGLACLTYSREAAREFTERLNKLGYRKRKNVFLGTVHSFCLSEIIGAFAEMYKVNIPMPIKLVSDKEKKILVSEAASLLGMEVPKSHTTMDKTRLLRVSGKSPMGIALNQDDVLLADEYENLLYEKGYIDFESIIIESTKMLQNYPYIRKCLNAKYPWILIDEYQDLGRPLHEMVISLIENTDIRFFIVGDSDQSIYGFQGAIPYYLTELSTRKGIKKVVLKNNYRSNQDIVDGSELILSQKRGYIAKTRKSENAIFEFVSVNEGMDDQYAFFVEHIIPKCKEEEIPYEEIAVLLSNNNECKALAEVCKNKNIPHYIVKHMFDRSDFVKWIESCANWLVGNREYDFSEIYGYWINLVYSKCDGYFISESDDMLERIHFLRILEESKKLACSAQKWFVHIRKELSFDDVLKNNDLLPGEIENLDNLQLELSGEEYINYGIEKFCKIGKPENQVVISTRHSSKGLEFEAVVMMGMEDERFPDFRIKNDENKMKESDRLCFVCVSRAKRICILMKSNYYYISTKNGIRKKYYYPSKYWKTLYDKFSDKAVWFPQNKE